MPDLATLVIAVDSKQVKDATKDLNALKDAGTNVESGTKKAGDGLKNVSDHAHKASIEIGAFELGSGRATRALIGFLREAGRGDIAGMGAHMAVTAAHGYGLAAMFSVLGLSMIGVVAALAAATAGVIHYIDVQNTLTQSTAGLGLATGLTRTQLSDLAQDTAKWSNLSVDATQKQQLELIRMGVTNAEVFSGIQVHLQDWMHATGQKAPDALKTMAEAMNDPIRGLDIIDAKVGGVTSSIRQQVIELVAHGDKVGADAVLTATLANQTAGLAKASWGLSDMLHAVAKGFQDAFSWAVQYQSILVALGFSVATGQGGRLSGPGQGGAFEYLWEEVARKRARIAAEQRASYAGDVGLDLINPERNLRTQLEGQKAIQEAAIKANKDLGLSYAENEEAVAKITERIERLNRVGWTAIDRTHTQTAAEAALAIARQKHDEAGIKKQSAIIEDVKLSNQYVTAAQAERAANDASALAVARSGGAHRGAGQDFTTAALELEKFTLKIQNENEVYGIFNPLIADTVKRQNEEIRAIESKKDAKGHYISLNQQEIDQIYQQIFATEQNRQVQQASIQIYEDLNKAADDYLVTLKALGLQLGLGNITENQFNAFGIRAGAIRDVSNIQNQFTENNAPMLASRATYDATRQNQLALNPLLEINEALDREAKLYGLVGDARLIQEKMNEAELSFQGKFVPNEKTILDLYRQRIPLALEQNRLDTARNNLYSNTIGRQRELIASLRAIEEAMRQAGAATHLYDQSLAQVQNELARLKAQTTGTFGDQFRSQMMDWVNTGQTAAQRMANIFATTTQSISQGIGDAFASAITGTQSLGDALLNLARNVISQLISALIQLIIQETILGWIGLGSGGMVGGGGGGGIGFTRGMADGGLIQRFPLGGLISGPGGPRDDRVLIWGSNGEFVMNAEATAKYRPLLEAMNKGTSPGRHYADGGSIGHNSGGGFGPNITFDFRNANLGGVELDVVEKRFRAVVEKEYAPKLIATSVQQSIVATNKLQRRQTMNRQNNR